MIGMSWSTRSSTKPETLWNKCQTSSQHSSYRTMHCKDLLRYKTEFEKKGFDRTALKAWGNTLAEIRELREIRYIN